MRNRDGVDIELFSKMTGIEFRVEGPVVRLRLGAAHDRKQLVLY